MFKISEFFKKFIDLKFELEYIKKITIDTIKEISGVELKNKDLDLKEDKVYLKCSPIFRNQIFMYKGKIEEKLRERKIFLEIK